ncbi:MerR family DNA-binding transcriptional regulator [Microvirga massiliensis]|uniref:MerR family DNA-binding transcriptional regulator n=1 Tax=Microvirga massiliensis TaxID=1033741 RepID=UPI00062BBB35|nr:MerR family DNA-binding transcriptional regulator [Microvirga massiliensis]
MTGLRGKGVLIGELSRRTGVNMETIRYYERIGMLSAPPRTRGGHRAIDHKRAISGAICAPHSA